jgi:uncharacterized membrane protein
MLEGEMLRILPFALVPVTLGCITGLIARTKGHSFASWWLFGAAVFVVALPMSISLKPADSRRPNHQ